MPQARLTSGGLYFTLLSAFCVLSAAMTAPHNTSPDSLPGRKHISLRPVPDDTLLFRSGFEAGVELGPLYNDGGGTWFQDIIGSDDPYFTWPMEIWGAAGVLQVLVDSSLPVNEYLENILETTTGHDGVTTRALHLIQYQKAEGWTQDPYIIFTDDVESSDLYVSYWMKYPEDLAARLGFDGWFAFLEWKTCCNHDRIAAYIYKDGDGQIYWYVQNDNETDDAPDHQIYWEEENRLIPVPVGEWFHVEVFLHRSTGQEGRFWWAVNGQTVADHHGPNRHGAPFNRFMPFTLYTSAQEMDIWVDDVEIRDTMP